MPAVLTLHADDRYSRAIRVTADLLRKLRLEFVFVGNVARAAWLGGSVQGGSLDVLAILSPEQKNQIAMMGSNRGFCVDRQAIEQSEELDLVPLKFDDIRVHILVASNALYARMVGAGVDVILSREDGEGSANPRSFAGAQDDVIRVAGAEDLALLLAIAEDADAKMLTRLPHFDRRAYNERLVSIGLPQLVIAE
jgi:hypothetical protein